METNPQPDRAEQADIPPLPEPWRPRPEGDPGEARIGCGRPVLVGCGCLVLVLGAVLVILPTQMDSITEWVVGAMRGIVVSSAPEDLPPAELERLNAAFDALPQALLSGRLSPDAVRELTAELERAITRAQKGTLETTDVERLSTALEKALAATAAPDPPPEPATPAAEEQSDGVVA